MFFPEDTDTKKYLYSNGLGYHYEELIYIAKEKWGEDMDLKKLYIGSESSYSSDFSDYKTYITLLYECYGE